MLTVPSTVLPSRKDTLPVGATAVGESGVTVAVSVTGAPRLAGLGEAPSVTVGVAWVMVCWTAVEVLPRKFVPPRAFVFGTYVAVTVCGPMASAEVVSVAAPKE